jgi:uncharacterized membrane protein YcaP (DUF421 family)
LLTIFIRAFVLYIIVIAFIRGLGKRELGQLQPYELVLTILLADLAASPITDVNVPMLYGIMPIAALVLVYSAMSLMTLKSEKMRHIITGYSSVLVRNGVIDIGEMTRQGYTIAQLVEQIRENGIMNVSDVGLAIMEISGRVSVFPIAPQRPVTPQDLGIDVGYEGQTLLLILDGRVQSKILHLGNLSEEWLEMQLSKLEVRAGDVFFCAINTQGMLNVQKRGENQIRSLQALEPKEVSW